MYVICIFSSWYFQDTLFIFGFYQFEFHVGFDWHRLLDVYSVWCLLVLCVKISVFIKVKFGKSLAIFLHIPFSAPFFLFPLLLVFHLHILNFTVWCYVTGLRGSAHFFPGPFFPCVFFNLEYLLLIYFQVYVLFPLSYPFG